MPDSSDDRRLEAVTDRLVTVSETLGALGARVDAAHEERADLRRRHSDIEQNLADTAAQLQTRVHHIEASLSWWKLVAGLAATLGITGGSLGLWANHQLDTITITSNARDAVREALAASPVQYVFVAAAAVYLDTGLNVTKDQDVYVNVTGAVNSALDTTVMRKIADVPPKYAWSILPSDGSTVPDKQQYRDEAARQSMLAPGANYRDLVYAIVDESRLPLIKNNPRLAAFLPINLDGSPKARGAARIAAASSGRILLAINENVLDDVTRYVSPEAEADATVAQLLKARQAVDDWRTGRSKRLNVESPELLVRYLMTWSADVPPTGKALQERMAERYKSYQRPAPYHRLFHDDNIGGYLVRIQLEPR